MRRQSGSLWFALGLIGVAAVLMLLSLLNYSGPADAWDSWFGPEANGSWKAVALDGKPAARSNYVIAIKQGRLVGGYDDCNSWAYQDEGPGRNGDRRVISTLVACPDESLRRTYNLLVYGPEMQLLNKRELRLSRLGHAGRFRRCTPTSGRCVIR